MGVADIGLENESGVLVPYSLNTSSVAGTVSITDLQSLYVDGDGPDTYGIQLNSVANDVTVFGNSSNEYWAQDYVDYTIGTRQLVFGDEVWNFSSLSGVFPQNSVYGFGPNGTFADFPYLYQGYGPALTIGYPFTLTLYLNTSTVADRPALYFNYTVSNATFSQSTSFDYLIFNSTVGVPSGPALTPSYQADGYDYDPIGLINDMEIDLVGNDDGDLTAFLVANATLSLQYWNATSGAMEEVPSAFNAGQETGETSVGLLVYSSGGPTPLAEVRTGPAFVGGLWNYSTGSGATPYSLTLHPANAFLFANPGSARDVSAAQWIPTAAGGVTPFYLPSGGTYFLDFLMADRDTVSLEVTPSTAASLTVTMLLDTSQGIYTPLFALDNAELAAISSSGAGTRASPYVLLHNQYGPIAPEFAQWDDYLFPVFPGLLLADTNAWVNVTPPSFAINIPAWEEAPGYIAALGLPTTNNLQIQFYAASHITLQQAPGISGWMSVFEVEYPESSVMLWNCTSVLVAANTFDDEGDAILLYGGTNNTVWGNTFVPTPVLASDPESVDDAGIWVTGVNETEAGDLLYNNLFEIPVPAVTPTYDPFLCDQYGYCSPVTYSDTWNVSEEPATDSSMVLGYPLTGSVIGTWYQGGNYWSNYGTTQNPYGVVPLAAPYNDSGWITAGGDFVPLVPFSLYSVTFREFGLPSGSLWNVTANGVLANSTTSAIVLYSPNGTFPLVVQGPSGFAPTGPDAFTVFGASSTVNVTFVPLVTLEVDATGLTRDAEWSVTINGTGTGNTNVTESNDTPTIFFEVPDGTYNVSAFALGYAASPAYRTVVVGPSGAVTSFGFALPPGSIHLKVSPASASVRVDGQRVALSSNGTMVVSASAGLHAIEATAAGYETYFDNISVTSQETTDAFVNLTAIPTSALGSLGPGLVTGLGALAAVFLAGMIYFVVRRPRKGAPAPAPPTPTLQELPPPPGTT